VVDFINEVEEELRKDVYNKLLKKYGPYILAILVVIVASTGFLEFQKYQVKVNARAASASYEIAGRLAKEGDFQAAIDKFVALSDVAPAGYAGLSLSRAAGLKVQLGDLDSAVELFDRSANTFENKVHKDLSSLKAAYLLLEQERYDDVLVRVTSLIGDDAPYQDLAKELEAQVLLKKGSVDQARTKLTYLSTAPGVAAGIKSRSAQALKLLDTDRPVPNLNDSKQELVIPSPEAVTPDSTQTPKGE
jgi:hypothetical protein